MRKRRWVRPALWALLALSLVLRVWYGSADLHSDRFYDERYSFHNVTSHLVHGRAVPANAFYTSLSYLPVTALLAATEAVARLTGLEGLSVFGGEGTRYSPTAYLLCRLVSALYGTASLLMLFRIGRRLFDPLVGLVAALLLSAVPHHLLSSAMFKPDILVVLLSLVAFDAALSAVRAPARRRDLVAGGAVGLAVSAKYTGVGAALFLAAGVLTTERFRPALRRLAVAAVAALATFVALNPWLGTVLAYLPRLAEDYARRGDAAGGSHLAMLAEEAGFLLRHHGPVIAAALAAGLVALGVRCWQGRVGGRSARPGIAMLLGHLVGYSLLYAAGSTLFKGQNYLPVVASSSLVAAWALVAAWRGAAGRLAPLGRPAVAGALLAVGAVLLLAGPVARIHREVVPTTRERAADWLARRLRPVELRHVYAEEGAAGRRPLRVYAGPYRTASTAVESLPLVGETRLERADAELFPVARLEGEGSAFYLRRLAGAAGRSRRFEPAPLAARGPAVVVLLHPWEHRLSDALSLAPAAGRRGYAGELAAAPAGGLVSLSAVLPRAGERRPVLRVAGYRLPLHLTQGRRERGVFLSPRFPVPRGGVRISLTYPEPLPLEAPPRVEVHRWGGVDSRR